MTSVFDFLPAKQTPSDFITSSLHLKNRGVWNVFPHRKSSSIISIPHPPKSIHMTYSARCVTNDIARKFSKKRSRLALLYFIAHFRAKRALCPFIPGATLRERFLARRQQMCQRPFWSKRQLDSVQGEVRVLASSAWVWYSEGKNFAHTQRNRFYLGMNSVWEFRWNGVRFEGKGRKYRLFLIRTCFSLIWMTWDWKFFIDVYSQITENIVRIERKGLEISCIGWKFEYFYFQSINNTNIKIMDPWIYNSLQYKSYNAYNIKILFHNTYHFTIKWLIKFGAKYVIALIIFSCAKRRTLIHYDIYIFQHIDFEKILNSNYLSSHY